MIRFQVRSGEFHNKRVFATHSSIDGAFEDVSVHSQECFCHEIQVVAVGSAAELEAAGAYTNEFGMLCYPRMLGGKPVRAVMMNASAPAATVD